MVWQGSKKMLPLMQALLSESAFERLVAKQFNDLNAHRRGS